MSVKEIIVSAAWELFYSKGFNNTTVDDIIRESNTSKGSFYYYFHTKDDLLKTLADVLDDYYEELEKQIDEGENCFNKLLNLNYEVHSMMERKISLDILSSLYSTQLISHGQRSLLDQNRKYYKLITEIIEEGQFRGEISNEGTVTEYTRFYSMCERALVYDWCLSKGEYSLGEYSKKSMPYLISHLKAKQEDKR
ncbi:MAG: TetR family transcriptional regulator [Suipraeoptans sp.]